MSVLTSFVLVLIWESLDPTGTGKIYALGQVNKVIGTRVHMLDLQWCMLTLFYIILNHWHLQTDEKYFEKLII